MFPCFRNWSQVRSCDTARLLRRLMTGKKIAQILMTALSGLCMDWGKRLYCQTIWVFWQITRFISQRRESFPWQWHGLVPLHIPCRSTMTFPGIQIWQSDWGVCLASILRKTLTIPILLRVLPSFGEGGISHCPDGSEIMSTSRLEVTGRGWQGPFATPLWCGC